MRNVQRVRKQFFSSFFCKLPSTSDPSESLKTFHFSFRLVVCAPKNITQRHSTSIHACIQLTWVTHKSSSELVSVSLRIPLASLPLCRSTFELIEHNHRANSSTIFDNSEKVKEFPSKNSAQNTSLRKQLKEEWERVINSKKQKLNKFSSLMLQFPTLWNAHEGASHSSSKPWRGDENLHQSNVETAWRTSNSRPATTHW